MQMMQENLLIYYWMKGLQPHLTLPHHVAMARYFAPERNWNPTSSIEMQNVDAA